MLTIPAFVSLNSYFERCRGRAVALAGISDGIGGLALPPLLTAMYAYYGYPGVMVAFAMVAAQVCSEKKGESTLTSSSNPFIWKCYYMRSHRLWHTEEQGF